MQNNDRHVFHVWNFHKKKGAWKFYIPGADITSTFYYQFIARMFPKVPQNSPKMFPITLLRNMGNCSCYPNTFEELGELLLFPKCFWGSWGTIPVTQIPLRKLRNCSRDPNNFEEVGELFPFPNFFEEHGKLFLFPNAFGEHGNCPSKFPGTCQPGLTGFRKTTGGLTPIGKMPDSIQKIF